MTMRSSNYSIGGYFQLECMGNGLYHNNGVLLNSGRNALRYIIQAYNIKKLIVPAYTCHEVIESIKLEDCVIKFYNLNENFLPNECFQSNEFILYTNYFGLCERAVIQLHEKYPNLIVDNSQAFYSPSASLASFYSPRKFFGLPDGGILFSQKKLDKTLDEDYSYERCSHLLIRWDEGTENGYSYFQSNDKSLKNQPIKAMSKLTKALMGNINYQKIKYKRINNYKILDKYLRNSNELIFELSENDVPMIYPYFIRDDKIRDKLIQNRIYIAKYWPDIEILHPLNSYEKHLQDYLLPLPIDQRYNEQDMKLILGVIFG